MVGEEIDRFGLGAVGEQRGDVWLDGALLEQIGKGFCPLRLLANDDTAGVQVVVEGFAFAEEFGREDQVVGIQRLSGFCRVVYRYRRLDNHHLLWVDRDDILDDCLDEPGIEIVGLGVVVGGGGDDDEVGTGIGLCFVRRGAEVQRLVGQEVFDLFVFDQGFFLVQ